MPPQRRLYSESQGRGRLAGLPQSTGKLGSSPGSSPQEPTEQNLSGTFNTILCIMNMGEETPVCCLKPPDHSATFPRTHAPYSRLRQRCLGRRHRGTDSLSRVPPLRHDSSRRRPLYSREIGRARAGPGALNAKQTKTRARTRHLAGPRAKAGECVSPNADQEPSSERRPPCAAEWRLFKRVTDCETKGGEVGWSAKLGQADEGKGTNGYALKGELEP